jgi:hypothetical protein
MCDRESEIGKTWPAATGPFWSLLAWYNKMANKIDKVDTNRLSHKKSELYKNGGRCVSHPCA